MRRKLIPILILAGVAVGVPLALRARVGSDQKPEFQTATVERGDITVTVSATGTLQPLTTVDIKSRAGGRVDVLAVDIGSIVKPGQLIAKIDPTDTLANVRTAQADSAASRAKVEQANTNLRLQKLQSEAQIRQAEEALRSARARLAQAEKQAKVQPNLTKSSIAQAQAGYDSAVQALRQLETATVPQTRASVHAAHDEARANLASAEENLRMLEKATLPQERAQAQAAYDQAKANVEIASKNLKRQRDLRAQGFIAQSVVEEAENRYELAVAQAASAKEKMDTLEAQHASSLQSARHRVEQARAALANAQRRLETLEADLSAQVSAAKARVAQAKAQLENARAGTVQDQLKQDDVAAARAAVLQAEAALASARANALQIQVRAADIETARAQVASSDAKLQNANTQYEQTVITAPRAGVVLQKYVEQGTLITSGMSAVTEGTSIVQIGDISRMFVDVLVDEADIGSVEVGQHVDITVDAYPDELFEGKVTRIYPQAETVQNVTAVRVTVEVENPDRRLKPNMNASCEFRVDEAIGVLMVPAEAVKEDEEGEPTVTVLEGGKPVVRPVETGLSDDTHIEIRSGLKEGETVVTAVVMPDEGRAPGRGPQGRGGGPGGPGGRRGPMGGMPRGR
ncbi:MAG TPA: efflux RND transporter periplasmic adaptor subunit [Armatimonadota bacterium]|nr:efflux RND transporter periplasmic adaptor subunit [Armatimonadota bacterium]HOM82674.1 efflux RND transporter periplasmic adaptor subunit [Armatimonadota bacterium]HOQ28431.1 efflux RND transporter periplasmic adaptor subunit [Armatimonadota bacterium]HPT97999.1 efflux RND transporter periplasmic adaptor subunit [Armatimonadota bacterium]